MKREERRVKREEVKVKSGLMLFGLFVCLDLNDVLMTMDFERDK